MQVSRRNLLKAAGVAGIAMSAPGILRAQSLETTDVTIAVGGKALIHFPSCMHILFWFVVVVVLFSRVRGY